MSHHRIHRRIAAAVVLVAARSGLVACSSEPLAPSPVPPDGATTLELWTHAGGNDAELGVINTIVDDFNASQDKYSVKVTEFPQDAYNDAVVAAATPTTCRASSTSTARTSPNWAWAGYIQPLGLPEDTYRRAAPRHPRQDRRRGLLVRLLRRRTGHVQPRIDPERAGVRIPTVDEPWTKDEFADALAKIEALGTFDYAVDFGTGGGGEWIPYAYSPLLQSFGGDLIDRSDFQTADGALNGPKRWSGRSGSAVWSTAATWRRTPVKTPPPTG